MKKIFFMMLFLLTTNVVLAETDNNSTITTVYEDTKEVISTVYSDVKDFSKTIYPEIKEAIVSIASSIGVASEHVYYILVKKFVVDGITSLIKLLVGIGIIIFSLIKLIKVKLFENFNFTTLIYFGTLIIGIVISCHVDINTTVSNIINPEWGAINYILETTKQLTHGI